MLLLYECPCLRAIMSFCYIGIMVYLVYGLMVASEMVAGDPM